MGGKKTTPLDKTLVALRELKQNWNLIAELPRAKRASEAPWVIKIGNPSSREIWLWRQRTSVLTNAVRTDSGSGGGASRGKPQGGAKECHLFMYTNFNANHIVIFLLKKIELENWMLAFPFGFISTRIGIQSWWTLDGINTSTRAYRSSSLRPGSGM